MEIAFADKKLEKYAHDEKARKKGLGKDVAKRFKVRLDTLAAATTLEDVRKAPGIFHELREDRKGQWACNLKGNVRLVFTPQHKPIPENDDGQYDWKRITAITIIEITDYHGK